MLAGDQVMSHSLLSSSLDLGLIDPAEVVGPAEGAWRAGHVPVHSAEGFVPRRAWTGWATSSRYSARRDGRTARRPDTTRPPHARLALGTRERAIRARRLAVPVPVPGRVVGLVLCRRALPHAGAETMKPPAARLRPVRRARRLARRFGGGAADAPRRR